MRCAENARPLSWRSIAAAVVLVSAAPMGGCVAWTSPCAWSKAPDEPPLLTLSASSNVRWRADGRSQIRDATFRTEVWANGYLRNFASIDHDWCKRIDGVELAELKAAARVIQKISRELGEVRADAPADPSDEFVVLSVRYGARNVHSSWASPSSSLTDPRALAAIDAISCSLERVLSGRYRRSVKDHLDEYLKARGREAPCTPGDAS